MEAPTLSRRSTGLAAAFGRAAPFHPGIQAFRHSGTGRPDLRTGRIFSTGERKSRKTKIVHRPADKRGSKGRIVPVGVSIPFGRETIFDPRVI